MLAAVKVVAWAAAVAASPPSSASQAAVPFARAFLQAFATNPQLTRKLVTSDALVVFFIGNGVPYEDLLKKLGTKKTALAACDLQSLRQTGAGHLARVQGVYACKAPDGRKAFFNVLLLLKDNLVAEFAMGPQEP